MISVPRGPMFCSGMNTALNKAYELLTGESTNHFSEKIGNRSLYRYSKLNDYVIDELENGLKMNLIGNFNDPYDSTKSRKDQGQWSINCKINPRIKCRCFSDINDSILMWSHYANGNKGICIEYEPGDYEPSFYKIKYITSPLDMSKFDNLIFNIHQNVEVAAISHFLPYLLKSKEWSYESEWRIMTESIGEKISIAPKIRSITLGLKFGIEYNDCDKILYKKFREMIINKDIPLKVCAIKPDSYSMKFWNIESNRINELIDVDGTPIYDVLNGC